PGYKIEMNAVAHRGAAAGLIQPAGQVDTHAYRFSQGIAAGDTVYVAGQLGWNAQGQLESLDTGEQGRQAFRNIAAVLAEAGLGLDDIAQLTTYVTDIRDLEVTLAVWREVFTGGHFPANTLVQ